MPEICQHFSILPKQKHTNGETADCSWDPMNTRSLLTHTACLQQLCSAMTPSYFRLITAFSVTFQLLLLNSYLLGIFGFQAPTSWSWSDFLWFIGPQFLDYLSRPRLSAPYKQPCLELVYDTTLWKFLDIWEGSSEELSNMALKLPSN